MDNEEIIELFFSKYNEQAFNEKILEDIDYEIPHNLVLNYVRSVIQVPFNEYVDYIITHTDDEFDPIEIEGIPTFYNLVDCRERMIDLMLMEDNRGLKLMEIGSYIKTHSISMNPGYTVVGRKSIQVAETLGIVYEYYNHWYLNCVAYVFDELSRQELQAFYARAILRNGFVKMLLVLCLQGRVSIYDFLFDPYQEVNLSTLRSIEFWFSTLHRALCKPYHLHEVEELEELHEREEKKAMSAVRGDLWSRKTDFDISSYVDEVCVAEVDLNDPLAYEPKDAMGNPMVYAKMPDGKWVKTYAHSSYSSEVPTLTGWNEQYSTLSLLPNSTEEIKRILREDSSKSAKQIKKKMDAIVKAQMIGYREKRIKEYEEKVKEDAFSEQLRESHSPKNTYEEFQMGILSFEMAKVEEEKKNEEAERRRLEEEKRIRIETRKKLIAEREEKRKLLEEKKRKEKEETQKRLLEKERRIKELQARARNTARETREATNVLSKSEQQRQERMRKREERRKKKRIDEEQMHNREMNAATNRVHSLTEEKQRFNFDQSTERKWEKDTDKNGTEGNICVKIDVSPENKKNREAFFEYVVTTVDEFTANQTMRFLEDARFTESIRTQSEFVISNIFDINNSLIFKAIKETYTNSFDFKIRNTAERQTLKYALILYAKYLGDFNFENKEEYTQTVNENEDTKYNKYYVAHASQNEEVKQQKSISSNKVLISSKLFKNVSTTYKFFWMLALIDAAESPNFNGKLIMRAVTARMVTNAWSVLAHGINFPKLDKLPSAIAEAQKHNINNSTKQDVFRGIYAIQDANFHRLMDQLESNVPYRFLSPWIPYSSDQQVVRDSNDKTKLAPYSIKKQGRASEIHITDEWKDYFRTNASILRRMTYSALAKYLHSYNPTMAEDEIVALFLR